MLEDVNAAELLLIERDAVNLPLEIADLDRSEALPPTSGR
jgi:hypothetical protein